MARRGLGAEQIVSKLRQIEVLMAQGKSAALACKDAGVSQQSYYRWRKEYGGLEIDQAKRMKELERENQRLKRVVADLSVEKQVLKDIASGNFWRPTGGGRRSRLLGRVMGFRNAAPVASSLNRVERSGISPRFGLMKMG